MANTDATQGEDRRGGPGWIPMAVAAVAIVAFMGWLATREPPESVAVVEPGDTTSTQVAPAGPAETIEPDVLTQPAATTALIGRDVEIASVPVQDVLGANMFWIQLPGGTPYLVRMDAANIAAGAPLPAAGTNVTVVGRVLEKNAGVLDAWTAADSLDENQRMLAEFGTTFIEARRVDSAGS